MSRYQFTPQATEDLLDIWSFIASDNPAAADRVEAAVYRACDFLADSPRAGTSRTELTPLPVRFRAAIFKLCDRLRSGEEATTDNPNSPRGARSFLCSQTADLNSAASLTKYPIFG